MRPHGRLRIAVGFATSNGRRPANQDFGAVDLGNANESALQGILAAIADGAGGPGGGIAAELAVRTFLDGTRSGDDLRGGTPAATIALEAYNRWLNDQARSSLALKGAATTFTAAVLRGRCATILHVGDSRAWHVRGGATTLLTDDHATLQSDGSQRLQRALGLEPSLRLDSTTQAIETHDRFLLSTDGVHGVLTRQAIERLLGRRHAAQADAHALVAAALAANGHDNATAIVIDVVEVPAADYNLVTIEIAALPLVPPPSIGAVVDGFSLVRVLAETPAARLFLAEDGQDLAVLKFPKLEAGKDEASRRFMREIFIGQRISHPHVGSALALAQGRQSCLYLAMPYFRGGTLHDRLQRGPLPIEPAIAMACQVGRGLRALHRLGIAHRDVKPQNIMLLPDGGAKILDFGVARLPVAEEIDEFETPGTLEFMAPELFEHLRGDSLSDQYALGVTLYVALSGRYPQGEVPPGSGPLFGPVAPPSRFRSDIPAWLDATILRALALRREERFGDIDELVFELEHGRRRITRPIARKPLIERDPVRFWKVLCLVLAVLLAASLMKR